ncbi:hypothetical protein SGLAD_v1c00320 [Spiroplasma gladiatoris]|uniref:Uncharacterized protein n=1 Tax=Spiroplasma gladiatoris TaxID=2143 RepID=A0A4P7AHU3_9MOLU|nr:hypothetical protein [Spiroplasma gladiatoris]QBQ07233.1 hypothetical protein SGLAD_v1c00320 [Spiroplasma gladiatoris]
MILKDKFEFLTHEELLTVTERTENIMLKIHRKSKLNLFEPSEELTPFYEAVNEIARVYDEKKCDNFLAFYYLRLRQRILDYMRWITRKNRDLFKMESIVQYENGQTNYDKMVDKYSYESFVEQNLNHISRTTFLAFCKSSKNYKDIITINLVLNGYNIRKTCLMLDITRREYDKIITNFKKFLINLLIEDKNI